MFDVCGSLSRVWCLVFRVSVVGFRVAHSPDLLVLAGLAEVQNIDRDRDRILGEKWVVPNRDMIRTCS